MRRMQQTVPDSRREALDWRPFGWSKWSGNGDLGLVEEQMGLTNSEFMKGKEAKDFVSSRFDSAVSDSKVDWNKFWTSFINDSIAETERRFGKSIPELVIPSVAIQLIAWSSYLLEAKAICHYRKPGAESGYEKLRKDFMDALQLTIIESRNLAVEEKRMRQESGDNGSDGDVPKAIVVPTNYAKESLFC